ncbi:dTDP-glucose 4,6-dehydratase [hydrothermal vent metagenome]|uniref:dTDP-glucose 4,6-dehydratase n=1 Tax=hydrothermal vent metagenome TaxID=652676 RepID=A0A3B1D2V0_9ZZZZ
MKLLVTGSAGFIGSNYVLKRLSAHHDDEIVSLDALTYAGNIHNLASVMDDKRHTFIQGEITDRKLLADIFAQRKFDAVINFAAESHVDRSIENPEDFLDTNVMGTFRLLEQAKSSHVGRFLQISTDEVYGSLGLHDPGFTESSAIKPSSPYSASKASADLLALSYHATYALPVIVTRCSNNYGPYQFPEKMIPLFVNNLMNDKPVPIYGKGENVRDWIHVHDHNRAVDDVLEKGRPGAVYNIGGGCEKQNIEIADMLLGILDKPARLKIFVPDRPGHDMRYAIDYTKIKTELGWEPKIDIETGLAETVKWYKTNQEWLTGVTGGAYRDYYERMYKNR